MRFDVSGRRTGKTTRLFNEIVIEMIKHPNNTILFYTINKTVLPEFINKNPRIKVNLSHVRGLPGDKLSLFVDDVNVNDFFKRVFEQEKLFVFIAI